MLKELPPSTIVLPIEELLRAASECVNNLLPKANPNASLHNIDDMLTNEDIIMSICEKVLAAKPEYLTYRYVKMATASIFSDLYRKGRIVVKDLKPLVNPEDGSTSDRESLIEGDSSDHLRDLELLLFTELSDETFSFYLLINSDATNEAIAKELGMDERTLRRLKVKLRSSINRILGKI